MPGLKTLVHSHSNWYRVGGKVRDPNALITTGTEMGGLSHAHKQPSGVAYMIVFEVKELPSIFSCIKNA
jgi:hypothetical protein